MKKPIRLQALLALVFPLALHAATPPPLPIFNIDFGPAVTDRSKQFGAAAAGAQGDFWNAVSITFNSSHTETGLAFGDGSPSPVTVEMLNLGGSWGNGGGMGVKAPMLDGFNYPVNNRGGDARVILRQIPPGKYMLYVYGHGASPRYNGDYTLIVGEETHGRKATSQAADAVENRHWVEGSQYVKFGGFTVAAGEAVEILIKPGGQVTEPGGRTFADAMICGLQLVRIR